MLVFQALSVLTERSTVHRYNLGIQAATTFALLIIAICVENGFLLSKITSPSFYVFHFVFIILQLGAATISLFACLFLPRRPSVYHKSQTVDKQYTVSAINRWTWTWASEFLSLARINKRLNLSDVPQLHFGARSSYLAGHFTLMKPRDRLWKTLFRVHWREFMVQWLLSLAQGVIQFAPQLAMYKLLELLEDQSEKTSIAAIAWAYVIGLGASIILAAWMEAWLHWIVLGRLGLLVRIELSALIFSKSMRRKDVKGVQKITGASTNISYGADEPSTNEMIDHGENDAVHIVSSTGLDHGTVGQSTDQPEIQAFIQPTDQPGAQSGVQLAQQPGNHVMDDLEDSQVSRQSTINLIAIDAKRIADFATFHFIFPQTAAKLGASVLFLVQLIGWKSLLAGFIGAALITPLNIYASKKFSNSQGDLMSARDRKMVVITEALHGIRQIKFSASERQWQTRIGEKRRIELAAQRRTFLWDAVLITIWILGPVMLSAISLAVYAVLHGDLSPSVAFTTITVFGQIEAVLAIIPELTAEALEAWISVNRIGEYLNAPEMEIYITPGTDISFENASLAWPSDAEHGEPDRFILKNVNVSFPNKELSVISGKTGAGKSLLLASILGEAELLGGNVHVPKVLRERYDDRANKGNWIIDSAIAFVAQIPWIENASIKDNILFDLPYDTNRYRKVLESCALMKDLKNLPDGELTDIGAQGINLSGGQRWRISFARALYSRAGILILDDIFSAVDAHVGRQLFEDALTGELGQGRTRLLVTHHVELCLPRTKYAVILGEGTVQNAGFVEDLQQNGSLGEILKRNEEIQEKDDQVKGHLVESPDTNGETLGKLFSRTTETSVSIGSDEPNANVEAQPKKFVEDEKREIGSVKIGIYKEYLMTSGGFWAWIPILFMFLVHQGLILGRVCVFTKSQHITFYPCSFT